MNVAIPSATHARRRENVVREIGLLPDSIDAVLITDLINIRYLTGFTGSNAALLISESYSTFATDSRYDEQSAHECLDIKRLIARPCSEALLGLAHDTGMGRVGFESDHVSVATYHGWRDEFGGLSLTPVARVVELLRVVKDDFEMDLLRRACAISDEALALLIPDVHAGMSERAVARRLDSLMLDLGADGIAFETICATGENSAVPHHSPTDRFLVHGDLLKLDFGAQLGGYHADMTRTFCLGVPASWQQEIHDLVRAAQRAGREAVRSGADVVQIDHVARGVIEVAGHGDHFGHGLGHGVGLEIHEAPTLGPLGEGILASGTPVTVEPGVYLQGRGGVRIEDTLLVTDGEPESLTTSERDLVVLG